MSYTGYDMEDAMILNKSSVERGFAHGTIYFTENIDLAPNRSGAGSLVFGLDPRTATDAIKKFLGPDGLPHVGCRITRGDPLYGYVSADNGKGEIVLYKKEEEAYVVMVRLVSVESSKYPPSRAVILLRIRRNPIIGDKFASRHGQKGVCSRLYPNEDLPFNEFGMAPDIIFNPHGFPSRMTMGMMLEFMATKYACMEGKCIDGTPFQFDIERAFIEYGEEEGLNKGDAFTYFGNLLRKVGFNYHGKEAMYSGTSGELLEADIFMGVVYYQKLRHMVSDKFQVRRIGPYDTLTHQPLKGRKRGGGIRTGEMERDAVLSHGCSRTLMDRLMVCSDQTVEPICTRCGLLKTLTCNQSGVGDELQCKLCKSSNYICDISIPYVLKYLVDELSSMNTATVFSFARPSMVQAVQTTDDL
ncbi:hypothetical protein ACOME3_007592 [Neoechinorhynchus agilis]